MSGGVSGEAAFLAAYALALAGIATGVERLGRMSTTPEASRALAAARRSAPHLADSDGDPRADWPHSEVPRLHAGVALVAVAAGATLVLVALLRHHRLAEAVLLGAVLAALGWRACALARRLRSSESRSV